MGEYKWKLEQWWKNLSVHGRGNVRPLRGYNPNVFDRTDCRFISEVHGTGNFVKCLIESK